MLGDGRIIHSVECPFISNEGAKPFIDNAPISEEDKKKIAHRNAELLFGQNEDMKQKQKQLYCESCNMDLSFSLSK